MSDLVTGVQGQLKTAILGHDLVHLPEVGSTNDRARQDAVQGQPEGLLVVADRQTAGRGRMGRTWHGADGSLLMSLLLRPSFHPSHLFALTMLSATAIRQAIQEVTGLHCDLKWPNDLQIGGRKLGGILTEAGFHGEGIDFAIIGLGLNVNLDVMKYPDISNTATSLRRELGRDTDRSDLLCSILEQIEIRYGWATRGSFDLIHQEWRSALVNLGKRVKVVDRDQVLEGLAVDVDPEGTLLIRTDDHALVRVVTGDVSLR